MILIDNVLIHQDVINEAFVCDLDKCKGACCWEGEYGAPLDEKEIKKIEKIKEIVLGELEQENKDLIKKKGVAVWYNDLNQKGTPLMEDGSCAFLIKDKNGIGKCAFEKIWEEGKTDFKKPISCHLYPIRISQSEATDMEFVNYDRWKICSAACSLGKKLKVPLFEFCSDALERKYGKEFVEKLRAVKQNWHPE
ncbi:MAG: DUF3109 family protein [Saprospirales bacterium]|nr:MAG: DUF3109 family protein [Saprospirales bacterium]